MFKKGILIVGGSVVAITLGNTRLGPIVALLLLAVLAYVALSNKTLSTNAKTSQVYTGPTALVL